MAETVMKPVARLTNAEKTLMNEVRVREGGKGEGKDFDKDYPKGTVFFFVRENGRILSFGGLEPVRIEYEGKSYDILGICNVFSVERGRGYGTILIREMRRYLKERGKTGIGFTGSAAFFRKAGLNTEKSFGRRFALRNPKTGEVRFEEEGEESDGIYCGGEDKLIQEMLKSRSIGYYWLPGTKKPHF